MTILSLDRNFGQLRLKKFDTLFRYIATHVQRSIAKYHIL